ncbi:hypothetical protein SAY87_017051 [Trapa incisa]|uniref:PPM-type phosphatase domain-containing protein n=1 Tax=Trapa incisa TaxID=236973 RepID=A0AAN7L9P4_9MYRT|nr:hypothetical protein SAY87_017051 [Trapa incisa]
MKGSSPRVGSKCPLSCEPELEDLTLTEEDEFLIIGCDGLWDVELMQHNDPERSSWVRHSSGIHATI